MMLDITLDQLGKEVAVGARDEARVRRPAVLRGPVSGRRGVLSRLFGVSIEAITWFFRLAAVFVPPILAAIGYRHSTRRLAARYRDLIVSVSSRGPEGKCFYSIYG